MRETADVGHRLQSFSTESKEFMSNTPNFATTRFPVKRSDNTVVFQNGPGQWTVQYQECVSVTMKERL